MRKVCLCTLLSTFLFFCAASAAQTFEEIAKSAELQLNLPGWHHLEHCKCYSHYYIPPEVKGFESARPGAFPLDTPVHPKSPADILWHHFMKRFLEAKGKSPLMERHELENILRGSRRTKTEVYLLSDYLNVIQAMKRWKEKNLVRLIKSYKEMLCRPRDSALLEQKISYFNKQALISQQILDALSVEIIPLYQNVLEACSQKAQDSLAVVYNRGLLSLAKGDYGEALNRIGRFIELADRPAYRTLLNSHVFQIQGECHLEVGQYHEAIEALTSAIRKDPENKDAYFSRASAYFEAGQFDSSLQDFLTSGGLGRKNYHVQPVSSTFFDAFTMSLSQGAIESCTDFVPNLCNTACGLGRVLWDCAQHPVASAEQFAGACLEAGDWFVEYCATLDQDKIEGYVDELKQLYTNFKELDDTQKGMLLGKAVGKYGVEILAGTAVCKGVLALQGVDKAKKVRELNRLCNMEAMASSSLAEESVVKAAVKHTVQREAYFESVEIFQGAQNKHIRGHTHFRLGKSVLEHPDPDSLLKRFAGTGRVLAGEPGQPGFKEVVDCGEYVGLWVREQDGLSFPTTRITIHYSKKGAHIVPAEPKL